MRAKVSYQSTIAIGAAAAAARIHVYIRSARYYISLSYLHIVIRPSILSASTTELLSFDIKFSIKKKEKEEQDDNEKEEEAQRAYFSPFFF